MNKGKFFLASMIIMILLTSVLLAACGSSSASSSSSAPLDGKALLEQRCTVCHDLGQVSQEHGNAQQWSVVVSDMVRRGAKLNAQEKQTLVDYLAQMYP